MRELFEKKSLTFTILSKQWGIKTGTLYFHLKELDNLVSQNNQKHYVLTDTGKEVCSWFIGTKEGSVVVERLDVYTLLGRRILRIINGSIFITFVYFITFLFAMIFSEILNIVIVGTFIVPISADIKAITAIVINFGSFIFFALILSGLLTYNNKDFKHNLKNSIFFLVLSNLFSISLIAFLILINQLIFLPISFAVWFLISVISQIIFVYILSTLIVQAYGLKVEKSLLFGFLILYLSLTIATLII